MAKLSKEDRITRKQIGKLIHLIKNNNISILGGIHTEYEEIYKLSKREASVLIYFFDVELKELLGKHELINRVYEVQEIFPFWLPEDQWELAKYGK